MVENAKIQKLKCDFLRHFQTMWAANKKAEAYFSDHDFVMKVLLDSKFDNILQSRVSQVC